MSTLNLSTLNSPSYVEDPRGVESRAPSVADVKHLFANDRLHHAATQLVRELHDGVLQSLTAAVLQLEAAAHLIDTDAHSAQGRLRDVQSMIRQQQRELRGWAERLEAAVEPIASAANVTTILQRRG